MRSGEQVFTVHGAVATPAVKVTLAEAGLRERQHLQEWVLAHPSVLGDDVRVVSSEFGAWEGTGGHKAWDRLDVLGLDRDGRPVVVELKRDVAPDTVDMQALKYAALVSRFTVEDLVRLHAQFLTSRGTPCSHEEARRLLDDHALLSDELLQQPRLVLMASDFPRTVTATVVFLHQQLGLDVRLVSFAAYKTAGGETLVTASQLYPPPEVGEFVLTPAVAEKQASRSQAASQQREVSAVRRLLASGVLPVGARFSYKSPVGGEINEAVLVWLEGDERRGWATWRPDVSATRPLVWDADGQSHSPSGLAQHILRQGAGKETSVQGPAYWVDDSGTSLLAHANTSAGEAQVFADSIDSAMPEAQSELRRLYDWAMALADEGLAEPVTTIGAGRWALNLRLPGEDVAAVTIWHDKVGSLTAYRSVLERRAPEALVALDTAAPGIVGNGKSLPSPVPEEILDLLAHAYREAEATPSSTD